MHRIQKVLRGLYQGSPKLLLNIPVSGARIILASCGGKYVYVFHNKIWWESSSHHWKGVGARVHLVGRFFAVTIWFRLMALCVRVVLSLSKKE